MDIYRLKVVLEAEYALMSFSYKDCQFECFIEFNTSVASGYGDEDLPEYKVKGEPFIEGINFELTSVYANINKYDCELDLAVEKPSDIMRYKEMIAQGIIDSYLTLTNKQEEGIK